MPDERQCASCGKPAAEGSGGMEQLLDDGWLWALGRALLGGRRVGFQVLVCPDCAPCLELSAPPATEGEAPR